MNIVTKNLSASILISVVLLTSGCFSSEINDAKQLEIRPGLTHTALLNSVVGCEKMDWTTSKNAENKKIVRMDCLLNPKLGIQADIMKAAANDIYQRSNSDISEEKRKTAATLWMARFGPGSKVVISYTFNTEAKKPEVEDILVLVDGNESSIGSTYALNLFAVLGLQQAIDLKQQKLQWARILLMKAMPNPMSEPFLITLPSDF